MFVSHPQYAFPVPRGLADPETQHWRLIEFALHTPWFLLTVDELTEEGETMLTRTWCIAWERDLAQLLATIDARQIQGLVCMNPGWSSKAGQWTSREIRKVWQIRTDDAQEYVQFLDSEGKEFHGGLQPDPSAKVVQRKELLQLKPRTNAIRIARRRGGTSSPRTDLSDII